MRRTLVIFALSLVSILASAPAAVQAQGSIKVVVNDRAITTYDIGQRARLIRLTQRKPDSIAKREAEQELIDETLQLEEAKRLGVSITDSQVNDAYANIARGVKMTTAQLSGALRQGGVQPETLKERLRAQLAWQQAVRRRYQAQVKISESDVIAALQESDKEHKNVSIEYDLRQIIVVVPKKSSGGFRSQRQREANDLRAKFSGCENPGPVLGQYSEVVLRPVGRRLETELPNGMRDDIEATEPGNLTKPQQTERGYEMIAVCGKREIASDLAARTEIEAELREKEGQQLSRRYINDLRRKATIVQK